MTNLGKEHWISIIRVFRYLHGMIDFAICYHGNSEDIEVHGFVKSNWDKDIDSRRLTSGYLFIMFGGAVSWMRRKQSMVSFSSIEDEYSVVTHASK